MKKIIYPIASNNLCIGITAPSSGLGNKFFIERFELVSDQHRKRGIQITEGNCLRDELYIASDTPENRALDFVSMWKNEDVDLIQPPWGGELLIDILEYIDFEDLKSYRPKWVQGYSDVSTLLFALTTLTGIASAHGTNFIDSISGQDLLTSGSRNYLKVKKGESYLQRSSTMWQQNFTSFEDNMKARFNLSEKTQWKILNAYDECSIKGRIIGGCFDVLVPLVGTRYGDLNRFYGDYGKGEGLVLYFENCTTEAADLYRFLYSMKYAGWFEHVNGVIFGRNSGPDNRVDFTYLEALIHFFSSYDFPVIYDADIGHRPPQMTIINGSLATLIVKNGKAELLQTFN
ncbi:LD-carboxypeptidase [bacterium]|nr:LD-carboxypeptidase [bacterium]